MKDEEIVREMLINIGENPDRPGLKDTPARVSRMWKEIFRGYNESEKPKVTVFDNGTDGVLYNQMISDTGTFHSTCEHHICTFSGQYWFAYIPNLKGKVLGISKVGRIVDFYSAKLQIQERLVQQIVEELWVKLSEECPNEAPLGMALVMEGEHLCKTMRGVKKKGKMRTTELRGAFLNEPEARAEFMGLVNKGDHI